VPRFEKLRPLVEDALRGLAEAYRDGRLTDAEYVHRMGLLEGWLRARRYLHPDHPPLVDPRGLWRPGTVPRPPFVGRIGA
jgi:hypothetical protein